MKNINNETVPKYLVFVKASDCLIFCEDYLVKILFRANIIRKHCTAKEIFPSFNQSKSKLNIYLSMHAKYLVDCTYKFMKSLWVKQEWLMGTNVLAGVWLMIPLLYDKLITEY